LAQAEALPTEEHLAHLTLARVRRHTGRPHLAAHILGALARVAPPAARGWLAWELSLAGNDDRAAALVGDDGAPAIAAARALVALIGAARAGDRPAFERHVAATAAAAAGWRAMAAEAEALAAALDPAREPVPAAVVAWRRGEVAETPAGLHAVGAGPVAAPDTDVAVAQVWTAPGRSGRRALAPGLALVPGARRLDQEDPAGAGTARTDTGIAVLALAGADGVSRDDFFARVYGFRFDDELHQGTLDVLVHRMRERLGGSGQIVRDDPPLHIRLVVARPLVVPDARCTLPLAERVLRALAHASKATAPEVARALHIPLRSVQRVLQDLVAEGTCAVDQVGRRFSYRVHDTTFTEITSLRL
jgi:hypothetical protein